MAKGETRAQGKQPKQKGWWWMILTFQSINPDIFRQSIRLSFTWLIYLIPDQLK
jgi:hypothetical protein